MSDTPDPFEFMPLLAGAAVLFFAWRKQKAQFGRSRTGVKVYLNDQPLRCQQCERDVFHKREGLLNTTWVTLLKLDPFNESAHCLTCESCGHVHWFARRRGAGPSEYLRYEGGMDPQDQ